jgi:hypothetical protein
VVSSGSSAAARIGWMVCLERAWICARLTTRSGGRLPGYGCCVSGPRVPRVWNHRTSQSLCGKDARLFSSTQACCKLPAIYLVDILADCQNTVTTEPFLIAAHNLLAHASAHRNVIKLRDQKQLDFEELSAYLSAIVSERDRLAALQTGHSGAPVGLSTYLRDQVDKLRGTDDIHTRRERMRKMDIKIKEVGVFCELRS